MDELFGNYKGLVQDRVKVEEKFEKTLEKAEKEIAKYHELEDKAEEMVQAAAAELLPGEAGPSGVKAEPFHDDQNRGGGEVGAWAKRGMVRGRGGGRR